MLIFSRLLLTVLLFVFSTSFAKKKEAIGPLTGLGVEAINYQSYPFEKFELITAGKHNKPEKIRRFSLAGHTDRQELREAIESMLEKDESRPKEEELYSKGMKKGLRQILLLLEDLDQDKIKSKERLAKKAAILELVYAFNTNFLFPTPPRADLLTIPNRLTQHIGLGVYRAINLESRSGERDLSKTNPPDSSFWKNPGEVGKLDLYYGFGRKGLPDLSKELCEYEEPKTGFGLRAGFTIKCGKDEYKLKWGSETHSEPFNSRVINALGFNASIVDYIEAPKVRYNRRILTEFNVRNPLGLQITALAVLPLLRLNLGQYDDPFDVIKMASLKDGTQLSAKELRKRLLVSQGKGSELSEQNYNENFESEIDFLVFEEGSLETKEKKSSNVGGWGWGELGYYGQNKTLKGSGLGHEHRRELRGMGLLAAWLGSYDMRWDNNRLRLIEKPDGSYEMKHYISDTGSGLGSSNNILSTSNALVNEFKWTFTLSGARCLNLDVADLVNCLAHRFAIDHYQTVDHNEAFRSMTLDDARWMGRLIARLTREQIEAALTAAGFSQAEIYSYTKKLLNRRDQMVKDLGLKEFKPLLKEKEKYESRNFSRNPLRVRLPDGQFIKPPIKDCWLDRGFVQCPNGVFKKN